MTDALVYSIVIPAYNEERLIAKTLEAVCAIMKEIPLAGELIVVDNNSTDSTPEIAKSFGATVVFEEINQISRARNAGGRSAQGDYLIFVDADTVPSLELIAEALRLLQTGSYYGGGSVIEFDVPLGWFTRLLTAAWNRISRRSKWAAGCFIFVLKEAFDDVGGFSDKRFAGEELYFCDALKKWGKKRKKDFFLIDQYPVQTSGRRLNDTSIRQLLFTFLTLGLCRPLTRYKWFCRLWYGDR